MARLLPKAPKGVQPYCDASMTLNFTSTGAIEQACNVDDFADELDGGTRACTARPLQTWPGPLQPGTSASQSSTCCWPSRPSGGSTS
eukprot:scaffold543445_cov45-Prasinocladus_malaysianus.AAC.1